MVDGMKDAVQAAQPTQAEEFIRMTAGAQADEARRVRRFHRIMAGLTVITAAAAAFALAAGAYGLSLNDVAAALLSPVTGETPAKNVMNVVWNVRLPRIVLALLSGAGLAAAGAAFQALFANPLASPDTLGVATGASFGAVLGILWGFPSLGIQLAALLSGLAAVAAVLAIAKMRDGSSSILMIILAGMVVGALFTALVSLVKYVADPQDVLPSITFWMMGSLTGASMQSLAAGLGPMIAGAAALWLLRWRLNAASLSPDEAQSLGISVPRLRAGVIAAATLITASVVSMCGLIGWVGLLVPHAARMIFGANNRFVIPGSLMLGALFMLVIDTAARTLTESEIPVSILTAVVGAPFFIWLLRKTGGLST